MRGEGTYTVSRLCGHRCTITRSNVRAGQRLPWNLLRKRGAVPVTRNPHPCLNNLLEWTLSDNTPSPLASGFGLVLEILAVPGGVTEVRALAENCTHSGYFTDTAALARRAEALDTDPSVHGIYVTLNEMNPALLARRANRIKMRLARSDSTTGDMDITRRRWLPIDIDPVRPGGVSGTDTEHNLALGKAGEIADWALRSWFPGTGPR